jgi:ABC-type transporter Mla subunit MlaD
LWIGGEGGTVNASVEVPRREESGSERKVKPVRRLLVFIIVVSAAVGAAVAVLATQRQRLAPMTPEDRRTYLGEKLGNRLSDEQLDKLVDAISAKLDAAASVVAEVGEAMVEAAETSAEEVSSGSASDS